MVYWVKLLFDAEGKSLCSKNRLVLIWRFNMLLKILVLYLLFWKILAVEDQDS